MRANKAWRQTVWIGVVAFLPLCEGASAPDWRAAQAKPTLAAHHDLRLPLADTLRDGDMVLRRGTDLLAAVVLTHGQTTRFSHVGVVVRDGKGITVVHAIPPEAGVRGGVVQEPLAAFAAQEVAADLGIYRVTGLDEAAQKRVRTYLMAQLGKPFDLHFSYADDTAHYCTELVLKALRHAGFQIEDSLTPVTLLTLPEAVYAPDSLRSSSRLRPVADALNAHRLAQPQALAPMR